MCFDEYETPPITFEDDFEKYSKMVQDDWLKPSVGLAIPEEPMQQLSQATENSSMAFNSQEPTMNPVAIFAEAAAAAEHNYTKSVDNDEKIESENDDDEAQEQKNNLMVMDINYIEQNTKQRRVPKLKLKIPRQVKLLQDYENNLDVSTPEITTQILELEDQFDLVAYVDSSVSWIIFKFLFKTAFSSIWNWSICRFELKYLN